MCLIRKDRTVKVADRDLTFYKVLEDFGDEYTFRTFFRGWGVILNQLYSDENEDFDFKTVEASSYRDVRDPYPFACGDYLYKIDGGGFHLYTRKEDAERIVNDFKDRSKCVLVKAVIPKGTKYVEGTFDPMSLYAAPSICTKRVIYKNL